MSDKNVHDRNVKEFLRKCQKEDPERFKEVTQKYPVLSITKMKTIQDREVSLSFLEEKE